MQNRLQEHEIGQHEMWNAWLYGGSLYEVADECEQHKMKVIGYCPDIRTKVSMFGRDLDIGICAEYEDGDRIWCHYSTQDLEDLNADYGYLLSQEDQRNE